MLGRLTEVLANSGVELAAEELLDALWLARTLPRGTGPVARAAASTDPGPVTHSRPEATASVPPDRPDTGPRPAQEPDSNPPERPLHVGAKQRPPVAVPTTAHGVRVPDIRPVDAGERRSGRSLRPLRQRFPNHRRPELDLARTVAAMAETGLPITTTRPQRDRWLSLALVVDDGVSMILWQRMASDLRKLMERAGAFRDVRVYGLDTRTSRAPLLSARPYRDGGPHRPPVSLSDPTGDTLVLIVSDGVGEAWRDGRMRQAVDLWARRGPTAIVHVLPTRLWRGSGIAARTWHVRSHRRGGPTAQWQVADAILPSGLADFAPVPVPVLEPTPAAIATWARLLAAPGAGALLPLWSDTPVPCSAVRSEGETDPVLRFRAAASPEAYRLAAHLAAVAPITPPVMRLVRSALGPPTDGGHLAEVFLGGLMHQTDPPATELLPHQRQFDFAPHIRRGLLGALAPHELLRTTRTVAELLAASVGRSPDFPAWVGHPGGSALIMDGEPSFGWMTDRLLVHLGVPPASPTADVEPIGPRTTTADDGAAGPDHEPSALSPDWSPTLPTDPARLGAFDLFARNHSGWSALSLYLAWGPNGELATVRTTERLFEDDPEQARELIRTEAACLQRMSGVSAPALLDWHAAPGRDAPWLAAACLQAGTGAIMAPAPNLQDVHTGSRGPVTAERFGQIGRSLAAAVHRAHQLGLVHGALTPRAVLATEDGVQLIGWITASVDGTHSRYRAGFRRNQLYVKDGPLTQYPENPRDRTAEVIGVVGPGPTVEGDMYSVGAVLIALATGRWHEVRPDSATMAALADSDIDPDLAGLLWRCLSDDPAARPTAADLIADFDRVTAAPPESGPQVDGLAGVQREVDRVRMLASQDPQRFQPALARALNALADRSAEASRPEAAEAAGAEAIGIFRQLAERDPHGFRSELARSLNNMAVRLGVADRPGEAQEAIVEAVALHREALLSEPDSHRSDLALALTNCSNLLAEAGRAAEALDLAREAVDLYRSPSLPDVWRIRSDRARALNNLANRLGDAGLATVALDAATEAVALYREAVQQERGPGLPELATALDNLAVRLGSMGRYEDARVAHAEGLAIWRALTGTPDHRHGEAFQASRRIGTWLHATAPSGA